MLLFFLKHRARKSSFIASEILRSTGTIRVELAYITDITAFVPALDVFDDLLLDGLYRVDTSLGTYHLGNIGSVLSSTRLQTKYPHIFALANTIHEKRLESELAHPVVKKTGKATGRIQYSYLKTAKRLLQADFSEVRGYL